MTRLYFSLQNVINKDPLMIMKQRNLIARSHIIKSVRDFFDSRDFLEVETPHRIPANAPEEYIDPSCSESLYLQTSPEICMKRLLCHGHTKIYQICRCWRQGERGTKHLPEFTMLEWYRADCDYRDLIKDCEELLLHINSKLNPLNSTITYNGFEISLTSGLQEITVSEAFKRYASVSMDEAVKEGSFDEIMASCIEPELTFGKPVILKDYPIEMAALARPHRGNSRLAERFELYAGGMELANGFSELNDAVEQRKRFEHANLIRSKSCKPHLPLPEHFLSELPMMPVSAGIALGIDRLVMLFTDSCKIDDVIAFTPEDL